MVGSSSIIRSFLEFFSNPEYNQGFSPWFVTLNYFLFFLAVIVGIGFIVSKIVRESPVKWITVFSKYSPVIFIAPILDLFISQGKGYCLSYLGNGGSLIIRDFFTLGGPYIHCGISPGVRIEVVLILFFIARILWKKTNSHIKVVLGVFLSYAIIFFTGDIPAVIGTLFGAGTHSGAWLSQAVQSSVLFSSDKIEQFLNFHEYYSYIASLFMGQVHYITIVIFTVIMWFQNKPAEFSAWVKNGRWERYGYYCLLFFTGIFLLYKTNPGHSMNWVDGIGLITALIAILANGWAAAVWNDFTDKQIDAASNSDRPLHNHILTSEQYRTYGIVFFITGMVGALLISYPFFLCLLLFQIVYGMYSFSITRWKKYFLTSALTIGFVGTITVLAGYFFANTSQSLNHFPFSLLFIIFGTLCIVSQAKDFKDVVGDKIGGIQTLPVLLGKKRAGLLLTLVLAAWIITIGTITHSLVIALQAIPWILIDVIFRKKIPEKLRFIIFFIQIIGLIIYFA